MFKNSLILRKNKDKNNDVLFDNGTLKVILTGCLAIEVALMVMSFLSIKITKNAVVTNLKKVVIKYMAGSISANIDARIDKAVDASLYLSKDPMMINWIESSEKDENAGAMAKGQMLQLIENFGYDTAFLVSALSNNYWSCDKKGIKLLYSVSEGDPDDSWFFSTLQMKKPYEININYDKEIKDTFVWINSLAGDVNKPVAVTGVGMNLSKVIKELINADVENAYKNEIWLVDNKGDIYLSKNQKHMNQNLSSYLSEPQKLEILNSKASSEAFYPMEYTDRNGELYDLVHKKIKDTKWNLVVQIPREESISFLNKIIYNTIIACLIVIIIIVAMFNMLSKKVADPYKRAMLLNKELESKINDRTKELSEKNVKIQDSIDYAKVIQESILPTADEMNSIFEQYFVIWQPRDTVGGDFYWVRRFEDGILVILGDCTGHGVPGALMTMAVNSVLNQIVDGICHNDPARILKELDRLIKHNLKHDNGREIIQDGLDAGILFVSENSEILFSGAGIQLWIGYDKEITEIKGSRDSVGCYREKKGQEYINTQIVYKRGMNLYLATDGLKDQPGGKDRLPYGKSRIKALLAANGDKAMSEQKQEVIMAFEEYEKDEQRRDDIAMIGIKI